MTPYDDLAYPSIAFPATHPDNLAVNLALRGLPFARSDNCRVMEIGCGEGGNLIPMALAAPNSSFFGFDLAATAIAAAAGTVEALGLTNIRLEALDIMDLDPAVAGQFDYIVAHGVYSWIPPQVRERMLALIGACLAPDGVAFISYNAMPGWGARRTLRDILRHHTRGIADPRARLASAMELLKALNNSYSLDNPQQASLKGEIEAMLSREPAVLAHDELGEFCEPFMLSQVAEDAARHGLHYCADAEPIWLPNLREGVDNELLETLGGTDAVKLDQYADVFSLRPFHQTLFRRTPVPQDAEVDAERVCELFISLHEPTQLSEPNKATGEVTLRTASGAVIRMGGERLVNLFKRLIAAWPASVPGTEFDKDFGKTIVQLWTRRVLNLTVAPSQGVIELSERPMASPLARLQASRDQLLVTTLKHEPIEIKDPLGRYFITLLDGTRTRTELTAAVAEASGTPMVEVEAKLDSSLFGIAHMPLLVS